MRSLALRLICLLGIAAAPARAEDAMPEPPARFPEMGRLLATSGATALDGAGGGGLVPWALITGYGSRDSWGANVHATAVRLPDFQLLAAGLSVGIADRLELSFQQQSFDTGSAGARLGLGHGFTFDQQVLGAKLRLFGDAVADQDSWWPQVAIGVQHKMSLDGAVVRAVGARDRSGTDVYLAATRLFLEHGLLLNATLRATRANQFGLLGHGGDRRDRTSLMAEGSAALLLSRNLAVGGEFRMRPDNLTFAPEDAGFDVFGAWFLNRNLSVVLAYVDLGRIANQGRQNGVYLSLQAGF